MRIFLTMLIGGGVGFILASVLGALGAPLWAILIVAIAAGLVIGVLSSVLFDEDRI